MVKHGEKRMRYDMDDLSTTSHSTLSDSVKYYLKVVPSALLGTLLFALIASTTWDAVPFFALICGGLSIVVAIYGCVLVSTKMISDNDGY